ncbi:MAG: hypothetical protein ACLUOI_39945 [Eisenbergiella sp.]
MDVLTVLIAIMLIAVMAAATGSIFEQVGLPNFLGAVVIVLLCGLLNFKGSKVIEKFESVGTILLYGGYILFTIIVLMRAFAHSPLRQQRLRRQGYPWPVHLDRILHVCIILINSWDVLLRQR